VEEGGIVEGLGKTFWAVAMADRQEHAIKIGTISRKIIRCRPTLNPVGSDVLHVHVHGVELNTNDLVV
jgi:hypothetical protein